MRTQFRLVTSLHMHSKSALYVHILSNSHKTKHTTSVITSVHHQFNVKLCFSVSDILSQYNPAILKQCVLWHSGICSNMAPILLYTQFIFKSIHVANCSVEKETITNNISSNIK
jgi:hypothetical protein